MDNLFNDVYNSGKKVPYNTDWENGTGYFDAAVYEQVPMGDVWASQTPKGRKILLIGFNKGTVVLFQRYIPVEGVAISYAVNASPAYSNYLSTTSGQIDRSEAEKILKATTDNTIW